MPVEQAWDHRGVGVATDAGDFLIGASSMPVQRKLPLGTGPIQSKDVTRYDDASGGPASPSNAGAGTQKTEDASLIPSEQSGKNEPENGRSSALNCDPSDEKSLTITLCPRCVDVCPSVDYQSIHTFSSGVKYGFVEQITGRHEARHEGRSERPT